MTSALRATAILLLLGGPGLPPGQTQQPPAIHLERAVHLLRNQDFAAALPELKRAALAQPNSAEIENLLGITETQLAHLPTAEVHYRRAIVLNPDLPAPHKNLGFNQLNEKAYPAAERELTTALALDPQDSFTHYYLAILYLTTHRQDLAVAHLEPARHLLENDPATGFLMAKACIDTNHTAEALTLIDSLARQEQLTLPQNYELALLLTARRLYSEAAARFEYAVAAQPQSWTAQYDLAIAHLNAGHPEQAVLLLQPLAARQPQNATLLTLLGSASETSNQLPQALDAYRQALRADPQNPDRYLDYTRLLMDLDRNEEATNLVESAIPNTADAYALYIRLGVLRLRQGRFDDARQALRQGIALHPEVVVAYVALAQSFMQQGDDARALEPLLQARATLPEDAALEYYVGLVSVRLGRGKQAEIALQNSIRLRPDVVEPYYQLGKLLVANDRLSEAQAQFERVIALSPSNSNAHYQLSKLYARLGDPQRAALMAAETKRLMQSQREAALHLQEARLKDFEPPQTTEGLKE